METFDNTKLFELLNEYIKDNKYENYKKVVAELTEGNAYLLLPSKHNNNIVGWHNVPKGYKIDLGIYIVDDIKVIGAFTSEETLFTWAKKATKWISLSSKVIIQICEENDIYRIVVDSGLPTMVVLQRY